MIKTYGCGRDFYNLREDDISRLTYTKNHNTNDPIPYYHSLVF